MCLGLCACSTPDLPFHLYVISNAVATFPKALFVFCHVCTMPLHAASQRPRASALAAQRARQGQVCYVHLVLGALAWSVAASPPTRLDAQAQPPPPGGRLEDVSQKTTSSSVFSCVASQDHPHVRTAPQPQIPQQRSVLQCPMESIGTNECDVKVASVRTPTWCMASQACFAAYSKVGSW